jgi:hypothetical protein
MDLENMRSLGIRTIDLICGCGRHKKVNFEQFAPVRTLRCRSTAAVARQCR